jgi:hypothetical protein
MDHLAECISAALWNYITNGSPYSVDKDELILCDSAGFIAEQPDLHPVGIFITSLKQPESGGVMAMYCRICKVTTFVWNEHSWGKPNTGDYFQVIACADDFNHNMRMFVEDRLKTSRFFLW